MMNTPIEMGRKPVRIAFFTLPENYALGKRRSDPHRMNPEAVSPLKGYLASRFDRTQIEFIHVDSYYVDPDQFFGERFDIVGINAHWRGIGPVVEALNTWPLGQMASHVFVEGSYINSLKDGRVVMAERLREAGVKAFIVYGEPEPAVAGLVENITTGRALATIPNLLLPENNWQNAGPTERTDLSLIKTQPYQYLTELLNHPFHTFHIETSRGCYFGGCTFCTDIKLWGKGWRGYPIENVISLFAEIRAKGVDYAFIFDKDFWGNDLKRARLIAEELIRAGNPIPYLVALRADEIINGEHLLDSFKRSGLAFVFLGAETFSEAINTRYNKGVSVAETLKAIDILRKHRFDFGLGSIIDPLGTIEELEESLEVIRARRLWGNLSSVFNVMEIRSGSPYERIARKAGIIGDRNDDDLSFKYEFLDQRVARAVETAKEWLREVSHCNVLLLIAKRMTHRVKDRDQSEYKKYNRHRAVLQQIDFDFFYALTKLIKDNKETEIPKLKSGYARRYKEARKALIADLSPKNPISRSLLELIGV